MAKSDKPRDKSFAERYPDKDSNDPLLFSGIARSVQCFLNNGKFRDFRIVTLVIEDGIVIDVKYSDPYASFEAIAKLEVYNLESIVNLNNNWKDGKTLSK